MTVLQLQPGIIYGPINSRRLGCSLGINLLPTDRKLCSFDCIYCHYGHTEHPTLSPPGKGLPGVEQVLDAVEKALPAYPDIDYLTFSGNGEPTLHPQFPAIAAGVRRLRDELRPEVKLAILSNSTTVHLPRIREALALLDVPIMKLDAGDPETLAAINHPAAAIKLARITEGLRHVPNLITQSVLVAGDVTNTRGASYEAWLQALAEVRPTEVQIYSTDRPVPDAGVERVAPDDLQRIAGELEAHAGLRVKAYWA